MRTKTNPSLHSLSSSHLPTASSLSSFPPPLPTAAAVNTNNSRVAPPPLPPNTPRVPAGSGPPPLPGATSTFASGPTGGTTGSKGREDEEVELFLKQHGAGLTSSGSSVSHVQEEEIDPLDAFMIANTKKIRKDFEKSKQKRLRNDSLKAAGKKVIEGNDPG